MARTPALSQHQPEGMCRPGDSERTCAPPPRTGTNTGPRALLTRRRSRLAWCPPALWLGLPLGRPLREAAPAGQATGTDGPGPGGIWSPVPSGAPGPWPPLEPGSLVRPEKAGGGEERRGGLRAPETVLIPRGREMWRTRGSRRRHSGPFAGLRASNRPGSAPRGESAPAPRTRHRRGLASPPARLPEPDPGPPAAEGTGSGGPGEGARGTPELGRGAQGSDVRAPGPLSSRGPDREARGLGIADGPGRKESPGAPGSAAVLLLKCFLISAGRTALCSPATLLLIRCAFVLNGRCRPGHHGVTRS
ncbi:hypothetical protein R6Z07F_006296 [Ovis aries]